MKGFEFIDITTADVAFIAYGKDINELFSNAANAMFEVITDSKKIKPKIIKRIEVKGNDFESLMFNWLNELLFFVDKDNFLFSSFEVKIDMKKLLLKSNCKGEKIDLKKHEIKTAVKAATMHLMKIEKVKDIWKTKVILDI